MTIIAPENTIGNSACSCQWNPPKDEIWLCPECHVYRKGTQEFTSVSKVIKELLPADYDGVPPAVLENARLKGVWIDRYLCDSLTLSPNETMMSFHEFREFVESKFTNDKYSTREQHADDAVIRLDMLLNWWARQNYKAVAVQKTVYSEGDGVAGTFDLATEDLILDLKCVSALQPNYKLQLGAYRTYEHREYDRVGIIHVTKDKVKLVDYDANLCGLYWRKCVGWWQAQKDLI